MFKLRKDTTMKRTALIVSLLLSMSVALQARSDLFLVVDPFVNLNFGYTGDLNGVVYVDRAGGETIIYPPTYGGRIRWDFYSYTGVGFVVLAEYENFMRKEWPTELHPRKEVANYYVAGGVGMSLGGILEASLLGGFAELLSPEYEEIPYGDEGLIYTGEYGETFNYHIIELEKIISPVFLLRIAFNMKIIDFGDKAGLALMLHMDYGAMQYTFFRFALAPAVYFTME